MQPDPPGIPETPAASPEGAAAAPATEGLSPLALDAPAAMDVTSAFGVARAIEHGWLALKRAPLPMLIAGFLMALLDGSNGGFNGPRGGGGGNDFDFESDSDTYSGLVESLGAPLKAAYADAFGDLLHPLAVWAQVGMAEVGIVIAALVVTMICVGTILIVMTVARAFVRPGVIRLHSHILQTAETDSVAVVFSGRDRFLHMLAWEFMSMGIVFLVMVVSAAPGTVMMAFGFSADIFALQMAGLLVMTVLFVLALAYVGTGLLFGGHLITLEGRTPLEALKRSWMLARGHRLWMLLFLFCTWLVKLVGLFVGLLMCCVGLVVTWPAAQAIGDFAFTESFLLFTRGQDVSDYWTFWRLQESGPPPSPGVGGSDDGALDARLDDELRRFD